MTETYLHALPDFPELIRIVADEQQIPAGQVEKDYWIMHCLYGLSAQGFTFELKGGTSLSKGFRIIDRFSEDIDIRIDPEFSGLGVYTGKNHRKDHHINSRKEFYDWLADNIEIDGISNIVRDPEFDDALYRSGGIRLHFDSHFGEVAGLKEGILLEVGFDTTAPNMPITISSWAYDRASGNSVAITDNRAIDIACYHPGYTLVEKLQTISTKFRQQQEKGTTPRNFLRHYYDIYRLLNDPIVQPFIGTAEYRKHKESRFRTADNLDISTNEAFLLRDAEVRQLYSDEFKRIRGLFSSEPPSLQEMLSRIQEHVNSL